MHPPEDGARSFNKRAYTISEAAEYACVSRGTVDSWIKQGILSYEILTSTGKGKYRFIRIRKEDLDAFLDKAHIKNIHEDKENISDEKGFRNGRRRNSNAPFLLPK